MQYHSRAVAPASPSAASTMTSSIRSSASSSTHSDDGASSSSLILHSEEEPEDLGDPEVLSHELCDFFGGRAAAPKPKKVKAPKQKAVKVELPLEAKATGAQPRESTSRLRRLCKAIVPGSKA
ncbi:hypothetical protein ACGC1H_006570 [Rhizoctonia solani]|uniref:Uncharacterized protein n=1 Tax=Rhizoctonia solani TaxID=456999 RepID=A0A8H3B8H5_9AGAM|nr:unnamed protein product [Rhizoctonia solani]